MDVLAEFNSVPGGSGGAAESIPRKAGDASYDTRSIHSTQSAGARSIANDYGAAPTIPIDPATHQPAPTRRESLRPMPGREVSDIQLPNTINESFGPAPIEDDIEEAFEFDNLLTAPNAHTDGTMDTHGGPLDDAHALPIALDLGMAHDAGERSEFAHRDIDKKTHSTGLDTQHANNAIGPGLDIALDAGGQADRGQHVEFRTHERDKKTHHTGFSTNGGTDVLEPLPISLDYGGKREANTQRTSQQFRSHTRGGKPPPVRRNVAKKKKDPRQERVDGFSNQISKNTRGSVWNEMGRLDQEPFNQQVINDRMKATRAVDDSAPDGYLTGRKKGTKPNQAVNFNRLGELALSKRAARKEQGTKEEFRQQLNAHKPYTAKEMYWKAPTHFRVFDPTEYARERKAKMETSELQNWQPDTWDAVPSFCHKPTRDLGQCD